MPIRIDYTASTKRNNHTTTRIAMRNYKLNLTPAGHSHWLIRLVRYILFGACFLPVLVYIAVIGTWWSISVDDPECDIETPYEWLFSLLPNK